MNQAIILKDQDPHQIALEIQEAIRQTEYKNYFDHTNIFISQNDNLVVKFWNTRASDHNCWLEFIIYSLKKEIDVTEASHLGIRSKMCNDSHPQVVSIEEKVFTQLKKHVRSS